MNTIGAIVHKIATYADLLQQIRNDLRLQHPEWILPNGESPMKFGGAAAVLCCAELVAGCASVGRPQVDAHLRSTPETVVWGYLPAGRAPILTVRSGQTVRIDTVSHQGLINGTDPVKFFGAAGIAPAEVLPDAIEIYAKTPRPKDAGAHVLTGPIAVEGAEPGDMQRPAKPCTPVRFRPPPPDSCNRKPSRPPPGW